MRLRGLIFALPLSLMLWGAIAVALHSAIPAQDRHAIRAEAHQMFSDTRHDLHQSLDPVHQA